MHMKQRKDRNQNFAYRLREMSWSPTNMCNNIGSKYISTVRNIDSDLY